MSLYDEAILIQKPSGYKAEKLYNVVPSPEVTEQSSVEFDGVDDELITDGDSVAQPTTYSFWCKASETGNNKGVFGHGGENVSTFHFNWNSKPLLYLGGGYYRFWGDISAQDDGEWHHWVVYSDTNDITNSKLYCDGVLQDVSSTDNSGSSNAYTEGLTIGSDRQSGGSYFEGSISDFAVFSRELNQSDVTEIYNYGSPNDLLETSFVNDLESYYQMGDGILDSYPLIADQTDTTLGSELVTGDNSTFDSSTGDWQQFRGVLSWDSSIKAGKWTDNNTIGGPIGFTMSGGVIPTSANSVYIIEFKAKSDTSATINFGYIGESTSFGTILNPILTNSFQNYKFIFTTTSANQRLYIGFGAGYFADGESYYIDNVSIKQVQGNPAIMTNMSSADIVAWTPNLETDFDVARSSTTTRRNASGYIEQVAANVPRLNYDSGDSCPYLLTEAASTNLITYPISFGNSYWTKSGASVEGDEDVIVNYYTSDWSGGTDGWSGNRVARNGQQDGISDGVTSKDNCFSGVMNSGNNTHYVHKEGLISSVVNISFWAYIPSTNTALDGFYLSGLDAEDWELGGDGANFGSLWTFVEIKNVTINSSGRVQINYSSGSSGVLDGDGDTLYLKDFIIDEVQGFESPKVDGSGGFEREAYKLVEDTSNGIHRIYSPNITVSVDTLYSSSVYAKKGERSWFSIHISDSTAGKDVWFDLDNGEVGTEDSGINGKITPMADGWYRCSVTWEDATKTTNRSYIYLADADNSDTYTGDGTSGLYIAYAQLEESDYASSLMLPTTEGSTTSRVGDVVNNAGNQSLFSNVNSSGTLYAEIAANSDDLTGRYISLSDGTTNNYADIYYSSLSNYINMRVYSGGVQQASEKIPVSDISDFHKIAVRWAVDDFSLWVDGVEVLTDTSGITLSGLNTLKLSFPAGSSNSFYGKTKALAVFDYLSDDQMVKLTEEGYNTFNALATANNFIIR